MQAQPLSRVWLSATLWTVVCQDPVYAISQARILEWIAISSPGVLPNPGIKPKSPASPALAGRFFATEPAGKPMMIDLCSRYIVSDSLRPHRLQHARLPYPSLSARACPNIMSIESVMLYNHLILCHPHLLLSFPVSGVFPMNWLFASGGQSTGVSASASVLPINMQGWFLVGLTGLSSLLSKGLSRVFSNTTVEKHQFFGTQPSLWSNSPIHTWLLGKP